MQRNIVLLSIFLLTFFSAKTGRTQENFRAGISMGTLFPIQEFKSTNQDNLNAGFSENGFSLKFDGDYYLHNRLAVTARFNFGMSSMNKSAVGNWLDSEMFDYLNDQQEDNKYSIDYWQWSAPMLGLKYNYPIVINKVYIETGAFSGISIIRTPDQNLKIVDETNEQVIYSENIQSTSINVPLMLDAGIRIILNDRIELELKSSYFQSKADYEHVDYIVKDNSREVSEEISRKTIEVPVKSINLNIGLTYRLQK